MTFRLASIWLCTISVLYGQAHPVRSPRFEDYPVAAYAGKVAPPDFGNPGQYTGTDLRCFSADPSGYRAEQPNFAGHFVIGTCTCGSGCHYLFMWDARTGKVYRDLPFGVLNIGSYVANENPTPVLYSGEKFRPNSSLLIIDACREGTCDCGVRYYLWTGTAFRMIRKIVSRKPPNCSK